MSVPEKRRKFMKFSRKISFVIVSAVYALAFAVGIVVYLLCPFASWLRLLLADVAATVATFIFSVIFKNASVYDPYWSVQPPLILLAYAVTGKVTLAGALVFAAVALWAVRLTANWAYTFGGLEHQDWRYTQLREKSGAFYPFVNFCGIHMVPTLIVYAATLPAVFVLQSGAVFAPLSLIGFAICVGAVALQTVSDIQMQKYRKDRKTPFIETGLWKYSRHPNYLGEILVWWGVSVYALATLGFEWYLVIGAFANTVLFLAVSIPLADGRQSKKAGFAEYKARTRMLLPIKRFSRK